MNTTAHTEPEVSKEKKGRWRMSGLLGKDKQNDRIIEEEPFVRPPAHSTAHSTAHPTVHPTTHQTAYPTTHHTTPDRPDLKTTESANRDSAYGSSSNHTSSSLGLPTISKAQAEQQDAPVKIQMDKGTGRRVVCVTTTTRTEVFDADTGLPAEVPAGRDVVVRKTETDLSPAAPQDLGARRVDSTAAPAIPAKASRRSFDGDRRPRMSDLERTTSPAVREDYEPLSTTTTPSRHQNSTNFSRPHSSLAHPHEGISNGNNGGYVAPHQQPQHPGYNTTSHTNYNNTPGLTGYNNTPSLGSHNNTGPNYNNGSTYNNIPGHNTTPGHNSPLGHNTTSGHNSALSHTDALGPNNTTSYHNASGYNNEQSGLARGTSHTEPVERTTTPYGGSVKRRPVPGVDGQPIERMSTMASLKAAAAGIHGAGETLRGAINSKVEQRTGGTAEQIAAHDAITQRGLTEISTGKYIHSNRQHPAELHNNSIGTTGTTGIAGRNNGINGNNNMGVHNGGVGHTGGNVPITGGNSIPAGSAYETEGYAPSPLITQAQQGYQDNVPYLPDPLGEAPRNMASSLAYRAAHDSASSSSYPHHPDSYQQGGGAHASHGGRFTELDDSSVSPIDETGYSGDNSNVGTIGTPTGAPLYGEPPAASKKGRVRNLLRKKSVRN